MTPSGESSRGQLLVGSAVAAWRRHRGLTQDKLANLVGVSRVYLAQIESGAKTPRVSVLERLAKLLRCSADEFVKQPPGARKRTDPGMIFKTWMKNVQKMDLSSLSAEQVTAWQKEYEAAQARRTGPPDPAALSMEYFRTAMEYHVAARFAALSGFNPVAGVMFHHAVEFYLKGYLAKKGLSETDRVTLRHDLREVWKACKRVIGDASLSRFDQTIGDLARFWAVRYPDEIVERGILAAIQFTPGGHRHFEKRPEPEYVLTVDDLDALAAVMWQKVGLNPRAFTMRLKPEGLDYLQRYNKARFWEKGETP